EPDFKVWDWVVVTFELHETIYGKTKMITHVEESCSVGDKYCYKLDGEGSVYKNEIRHATPSEIAEEKRRRCWAKHGRDVNEYRVGDIIMECDGYFGVITELPKEHPSQERDDDMSDESNYYVKIDPDWRPCDYQTRHVEDLKIVCFAENRLDVKDDE